MTQDFVPVIFDDPAASPAPVEQQGSPVKRGAAKPYIQENPSPGVYGTLKDSLGGALGGVRDAVQETGNFIYDAANFFDDKLGINAMPDDNPLQLPNWETQTSVGKLTRGISQFAAGFVGAGKFMKAAKLMQGAGEGMAVARGLAQGAIGDFVTMDPHQDRLSNLINEFPALENPITRFLASSPDDSRAEGRFKNALEGLGLGAMSDLVFAGVRGLKALKAAEKESPEAAKVVAETVGQEVEAAAAKLREGGSPLDADSMKLVTEEAKARSAARGYADAPDVDVEGITDALKKAKDVGLDAIDASPEAQVFNYTKFNGSEDIHKTLLVTAEQIKPQLEQGVEKLSTTFNKALDWMSDVTGESQAKILSSLPDTADMMHDLAARVVAAKMYMQGLAREINTTVQRLSLHGAAEDEVRLAKLVELLVESKIALKTIQTEAARATSAGRIGTWDSILTATVNQLKEMAERTGGSEFLHDMASKLAMVGDDPIKLMKLVDKGWDSKMGKFVAINNEFFINSILSSPKSIEVDALSNIIKAAMMPAYKIVGGFRDMDKAMMMEGAAQYVGLTKFLKESWTMAKAAFKAGGPILDAPHGVMEGHPKAITAQTFGVAEDTTLGTFVNKMGDILRLPTRFRMAGDEFFKQLNYRAELYSRLFMEGSNRGLEKEALAEFIEHNFARAFDDAGRGIEQNALMMARQATFSQDLEYGLSRTLQQMANQHPALKMVLPFIRTPVNIMRDFWQHTPVLNQFQAQYKAAMEAGGEQAALMKGKSTIGGMLWATAILSAYEGGITGGGPQDAQARQRLIESGWQPYSIKVGDKYIAFNRMDPWGSFFGLAADFADVAGHIGEQDATKLAAAMLTAISKNVTSKTYLKGLVDALDALNQPEAKMDYFLKQRAAAYVPYSGLLGNVNTAMDPTMRETRTLLDAMMSKIPGLSQTLPARRSWVTGEALHYPPGLGPDFASPFAMSMQSDNPVLQELARLNMKTPPPPKKLGNIELTGPQYERLNELHGTVTMSGRTMTQALEKLVNSSEYDKDRQVYPDSPDELTNRRSMMVRQVVSAYRQKAIDALLQEDAALKALYKQDRQNDLYAKRGRMDMVTPLIKFGNS